jgi:putative flavoprotein involved in K+ transport
MESMDHGRSPVVIVVGAGPAGLAVSRELAARDIGHVVLERGEIGESWRRYYDGLVLHTGRHLSSLPGLPIRRPAPMFVPRARFVRYLEAYAATMALPIRCGIEVTAARRRGDRWLLDTSEGRWTCRVLVVATGIAASPVIPDLPGLATFAGRILHSIEYRRPEEFAGRRVLVVGAGNSGAEIAAELARTAASVTIAIRSGVIVVPRAIAGIPSQYLGVLIRRLPRVVAEPIVTLATRRRARRLPPSLPLSAASPLDEIPLIGMHLPDAITAGKVLVRPAVTSFGATTVRFADGGEATVDVVILATGFRAALGLLEGVVARDHRGFAHRRDRVTSADAPDLFFVGHEYDASGGLNNIRRDGLLAATAVAAALASRDTDGPEPRP